MEESVNAARLIPAYNADAQRPEDIYPLHNVIPELEWAALDSLLSKLKNATDDRARARLLPNARSDWIRQHLMLAYSSSKPKSKFVFVPLCIIYRVFPSPISILKQKNAAIRFDDVRIPRCSGEKCPRENRDTRASGARSGSCGRRPSCAIYGNAQRVHCVSFFILLRHLAHMVRTVAE